jgi:hypothetical protein
MKMHLGGQTFQTDDEIKGGVLHCLHSEDKSLYAAGISNLPGQWKTCVSVEGKSWKAVRVWRLWHLYSFCKKKKGLQANFQPPPYTYIHMCILAMLMSTATGKPSSGAPHPDFLYFMRFFNEAGNTIMQVARMFDVVYSNDTRCLFYMVMPRLEMRAWSSTSTPIRLHGLALNLLSTGRTLPIQYTYVLVWCSWNMCFTERVGEAVTLSTHIREALGTPTVLTEGFLGFPRSLKADATIGYCFTSGHERFLPHALQFLQSDDIQSVLLASLNKPLKNKYSGFRLIGTHRD